MEIKRGDIWLVNLDPILGHEINKIRPAIIIQNDLGNKYSPITIIAPLTSQNLEIIYPVEILLSSKDTSLDKDSKVLLNHIRSIDKIRLIRKLGKLNSELLKRVDSVLKISLGLTQL